MKGSLGGLLQQAQKIQEQMQKAQDELKSLEVTGEAGGGMVKVTMTGKHAVRRVQIDPSLGDDMEMLEDLVTAAMNDAVNRVAEATEERMGGLAAGLPLPPGFKMPF
jgi:hypothetical protein